MIGQSKALFMRRFAVSLIESSAAPLRRQVLDELRQSIIAGRLATGCAPGGARAHRHDGVSRTVVREALRQLESEGLISIIPNKGPVVRELTLAEAEGPLLHPGSAEGLAAQRFVENANDNMAGKISAGAGCHCRSL